MGKTKKLYLARRILAMMLAVAMSVTMIPSTALAAPADDVAVEDIVDVTAEGSGGAEAAPDADQPVDNDQPEEADTPEDMGDVVPATGAADGTDDAADVENREEDVTTADGSVEKTDGEPDDGGNAEVKTEVSAEGDARAAAVYEISVEDMETEAVYDSYEPFDTSLAVVKKTENGQTTVEYGETLSTAWKVKGADGSFAALAGEPVNVGEYELTLTCAAVADVHEALTKTVTCTITKAPLTIRATASAKPGAAAAKESVTATVTDVEAADRDQSVLTTDVVVLTVTDVREAYGSALTAESKLEKDGDYVADVTAALKADAPETAKTAWNNYEVEPFTADVEMADLVETRITVTLANQWKEADAVTRVYTKDTEATAPEKTTDYTYTVEYKDDTTTPESWKVLADAEVVGAWEEYDGCEKDEDGKVKAPINAGGYTYILTYEDTKEGKYAKSASEAIDVVIDPAPVTVEITNPEKLTVPAGTKMAKVLSQVTYKAMAKDGGSTERAIDAKTEHIWGTGYDDINVSQIYEPAFTLQVQNGSAWENIDDAAYEMQGGKTYRVIYDGKKAIYNADGSYAHRTGINSGYDENGEEINGADSNYLTDETPTADAKALQIEVQAGVEMKWNLDDLYADGKAGKTVEEAKAKDFDNTALYATRAEYKNKVKLVGVTNTSESINAVGSDFTYTWYKHNRATDLLDKQIYDQNKANGFETDDFYDDDNWYEWSDSTGDSIIAPTDAGIYKLEITYRDNTDDGEPLHYVKADEKGNDKGAAYYVINKIALTITPETGTYETLAGRTPKNYFIDENRVDVDDENGIKYTVKKGAEDYTFPAGIGEVEPQWGVLENITGETGVDSTWYEEECDYMYFSTETGYAYEIQAQNLGRRRYYSNGEYREFDSSIDKINNNYTLCTGEKKESDAGDKKWAFRDDKFLSGKVALAVKPMGTTELTFAAATPLAYEKTYDGRALTTADVKPETAYTLTANGQAVTGLDVEYLCVEKTEGGLCMLEDLRDAGEYDVYMNFGGNETYKPLVLAETDSYYGKLIGTVKIKPCEITLSLDVDETYEAGRMTALWADIHSKFKVEGYVQNEECDDEWAFSAEAADNGESAWDGYPTFYVNKKGSKAHYYEDEILHRGGEFEIHYEGGLSEYYDRNYVVKNEAEVLDSFKTVAKPARVTSVSTGSVQQLSITDPVVERSAADDITQTVSVREGIPYTTYGTGADQMKGNLAAFAVYAPEEFVNDYDEREIPATAMYKNAVEAVGGKVVAEYDSYFVALFDAATAEGEKKINIRWADKYIETIIFKMSQALCLGDLSKAVAPKSLAFNAAPKKLAVGETVQLDVKITKMQMTDVICLGYESSDEKTMHVDPESGYVTALKVGKGTTITVYPKIYKDGKLVKDPDFKEVKVAIEGTPVTAPKSVKVTPHGNFALVNYDRVSDGYRREIYVVDNVKNPNLKKAADIEAEVKKLHGNKNQWRGIFAIAPVYLDSADESLIRTLQDIRYKAALNGLKAETEYTVYVRNVCEAKTLSDGYVITQDTVDASAAGTAVSFKSLKSEVSALDLKLNEADGVKDITGYTTIPEFRYGSDRVYQIEYSKVSKGVDSTTLGMFRHNASEAAAESTDGIVLKLPLKNNDMDTSKYQEPKLEYYVDGIDKNGDWVKASKNDYMSVDKKGKIKFTGVGGWYNPDTASGSCPRVYVRDVNTGEIATIHLWVVADVDSVTAKKKTVNMTVGQEQDLNDIALYTYKVGKSKLALYRWPDMDMDAVRTAVKAQSEYFELDGTTLRAIKGGGKLELSLTDKVVKENAANAADATATITFTSKDLAPVKSIKAFDITNDRFGLTFTSAGYPDAFRVEIRDSANNMLLDKRYTIYEEENNPNGEVYEVWERAKDKDEYVRVKDAYRIDADTIKNDVEANGRNRLAKESQYTVKITALCGNVASKESTAKVKTTKIPAVEGGLYDEDGWYWDYDKKCWAWDPYSVTGGMSIQVSEYGSNWKLGEEYDEDGNLISRNSWLYVLSGNSYTLTAEPSNRGRVNDTLTWTVGDKKVATVKAAAGTYCITLKGMQPGRTTLEVKSKILNKTIARYVISVAAVGDAYKDSFGNIRYFGDDEPADPDEVYAPGHYGDNAPAYLPLSVGDRRKTKDEYQEVTGSYGYYGLFSFTAPETGRYYFSALKSGVTVQKSTRKTGSWENSYSSGMDLGWMKEGQTVYLRSQYGNYNSGVLYYVEVEQTERMESATDNMTVTGQGNRETFEFKAPAAGVYQFTLTNNTDSTESNTVKANLGLYTNFDNMVNGYSAVETGDTITRELAKDETVWLKTSSYLPTGKTYTLGAKDVTPKAPEAGEVSIQAGSNAVYAFTADAAGIYRLAVTVATANAGDVTLKVWDDAVKALKGEGSPLAAGTAGADVSGKTTISVDLLLEAGQTVYLNPVTGSETAVSVSVGGTKVSIAEITAAGTPIAVTADAGAKAIFTATETGVYTFTTGALEQGVTFNVYTNGVYDPDSSGDVYEAVTSGDSLSKKLLLQSGQTIVWTMSTGTDVNLTLKVEMTGRFDELKPGQSAQASVLGSDDAPDGQATAAGFVFTAPETGYYSFWSESGGTSLDTYGILQNITDVNADTCLLHNGLNVSNYLASEDGGASNGHFGISYYLNKDQTVYLKGMMWNSSNNGTFTVHVAEGSYVWQN